MRRRVIFSRLFWCLLIVAQPFGGLLLGLIGPPNAQATASVPTITQAQAAAGNVDATGSSLIPGSQQATDPTEVPGSSDDAAVTALTPNFTPNTLTQIQTAFFGGDFTLPATTTANAKPTVPATILSAPPPVQLNPDDVGKLNNFQVDTRLTQYLTYLAAPAPLGAGLDHIKATIYKGYDTNGIGKYDRQTLAANPEDPSLLSPHNSGQAVDITAVGSVTCKLVEHRIIGGHTTHWQPALPVKVAWQSPTGIANNPTPTGDSLVGVAGAMSASGIVNYLNSSGEMDAYVDYVKGLSIGQIGSYVGANILLKNLSSAQVQLDPLAGSVIGALGTSVLLKQLPGLPPGINAEAGNEDVRISAAKAQIEDGLGLPAGSLAGLGWQNILTNTGKRILEQDLGLPTNYLNTHDLTTTSGGDLAKAAFSYVSRTDDALNFVPGTIAAVQKGDQNALELAGANLVAKAFKLSDAQKTELLKAVGKNQTPNLNPSGLNTGNQLSVDALTGLLSSNSADQQKALTELKTIGLSLFQKAASEAVPSQFSGLTQQLLNNLLNPNATLNLGDFTNSLGLHSLFSSAGVDPSQIGGFLANPSSGGSSVIAGTVATSLNSLFSLTGSTNLSAKDVAGMLQTGNLDALKKLGGGEIDRAFHWDPGTGLNVINDPAKITEAMKQTFANQIGALLGLSSSNFTLNGNASQDYGLSLIAQRLGLSGFAGNTSATKLLAQIGASQFSSLFGLSNLTAPNWDDAGLNQTWTQNDILLGVPTGTTKSYLKGQIDGTALAQAAGDTNLAGLDPDSFFNQFGLLGDFTPDAGNSGAQSKDLKTVTDFLKTGTGAAGALELIQKIVGRSIDVKANFAVDDFTKFIAAKTDQDRTKVLLDAGLKLFGRSMGANLTNYTDQQIDGLMTQVKAIFSTGTIAPNDPAFTQTVVPLVNFFLQATGIPKEFTNDAKNFITGDYRTGLADLSFILWQKNINPNLPASGQLTYQELRDTLGISDPAAIQKEADLLTQTTDSSGNPVSRPPDAAALDMARQELNKQAGQNVQYKISDSFLRKIDPTIPAGFTKAMFTGTDKDRAQTLQDFAFNNLDNILKKINPAYVPGTLENLYAGKIDPSQAVLTLFGSKDSSGAIQGLIAHSGLSLGPLSSTDLGSLISYFALPKANQNILTDTQFTATWSNLDKWLTNSLGIGGLPAGISKSLFLASQHNWDFNSSLKDAAGVTVIASVNSLATDFATSKLTGWADKQLHMPAGSIYQFYTAAKAVVAASQALALAHIAGDASKIAAASKGLSTAQASLTVLAITTALQLCAACQQFFSSVDAAIHAPPGFTNAAVAGAIAAAMGLGYLGLYVAAAIYLFGVNSTSYECPEPPAEQFAISTFDQGADQLSYGYTPGSDGPAPPSSNPAPGQNPFDWDNTVPFVNATNQVWEGWARYFTGKLIDATLNYGATSNDFDKPLQLLTYRQANAEYFAPREKTSFGAASVGSDRVGLGFTQSSTKTTDYVYVAFGGYF